MRSSLRAKMWTSCVGTRWEVIGIHCLGTINQRSRCQAVSQEDHLYHSASSSVDPVQWMFVQNWANLSNRPGGWDVGTASSWTSSVTMDRAALRTWLRRLIQGRGLGFGEHSMTRVWAEENIHICFSLSLSPVRVCVCVVWQSRLWTCGESECKRSFSNIPPKLERSMGFFFREDLNTHTHTH